MRSLVNLALGGASKRVADVEIKNQRCHGIRQSLLSTNVNKPIRKISRPLCSPLKAHVRSYKPHSMSRMIIMTVVHVGGRYPYVSMLFGSLAAMALSLHNEITCCMECAFRFWYLESYHISSEGSSRYLEISIMGYGLVPADKNFCEKSC